MPGHQTGGGQCCRCRPRLHDCPSLRKPHEAVNPLRSQLVFQLAREILDPGCLGPGLRCARDGRAEVLGKPSGARSRAFARSTPVSPRQGPQATSAALISSFSPVASTSDDHRAARLDLFDLLARVGRAASRTRAAWRAGFREIGGPLAVSDREAAQVIAAQAARVCAPAAGNRVAVRERLVQVAGRPAEPAGQLSHLHSS